MIFRLAEQYLIRAECRLRQNNLEGATDDINIIRNRANLPSISSTNQEEMLEVILHERQVELFTEWGHRWLDLKRTSQVDAVMQTVAPVKGASWERTDQLYPIPMQDILKNPNLTQNRGY